MSEARKLKWNAAILTLGSCTARDCEIATPTACPAHGATQLPGSQVQRQEEEEEGEEEEEEEEEEAAGRCSG
jgi:ribosomal protein L12E/L44/L45/RPP1/RPP2